MKKATLIHCYSDHNYGDLGIILSTVDLIQEYDSNIKINCVSTYNSTDERFKTEHVLLKERISKIGGSVSPALFGIVDRTNRFFYIESLFNLIRFILVLPVVNYSFFRKLLLSREEEMTYKVLKDSDIIISKGGSFFCDDTGKLGSLSFFRLWYVALFSLRLKKKVVILAQSLGPLHSSFSKRFGNYLLKRLFKVVLREDYCLQKYPYLLDRDYLKNTDIVFFQKIFNSQQPGEKVGTVGLTIKYVDTDQGKYMELMKKITTYIVKVKRLRVKMLPQVPLDGDLDASCEVRQMLSEEIKDDVEIIQDFHDVKRLIQEYAMLDFVVGTRLHSCIFSWSVNVPAINISYHGTKSKGIYSNLNLEDWVLDYSEADAYEKAVLLIDNVINDRNTIIKSANENLLRSKGDMLDIFDRHVFK